MRATTLLVVMAVLLGLAVGCAGTPEPAPEPQTEERPTEGVAEEASREERAEEPTEAPAGPQAAFVDAEGVKLSDGASVTLPTGAPPQGRIYLWSSDPQASGYVTRDGSIPTTDNYWVGDITSFEDQPISSTVQIARIYRFMAVSGGLQSPVVTLRVNWQHEEEPVLTAPDFVVDDDRVIGSVTIPVGGMEDPARRLYIRSSYLGATMYVTNDGSEPSKDNAWSTGLSDGFYVFATDEFSTTYKAIAVLRESTSPVATIEVNWTDGS